MSNDKEYADTEIVFRKCKNCRRVCYFQYANDRLFCFGVTKKPESDYKYDIIRFCDITIQSKKPLIAHVITSETHLFEAITIAEGYNACVRECITKLNTDDLEDISKKIIKKIKPTKHFFLLKRKVGSERREIVDVTK